MKRVADQTDYPGFKKAHPSHSSANNKNRKKHPSLSSSGSLESDDSSSSGGYRKHEKKLLAKSKEKKYKLKKNSSKIHQKKCKHSKKEEEEKECIGPDIPPEFQAKSKEMAPMTKEEWEKKQSVIRRVFDPETGRHRLIRGDGEILEEIVSRERHFEINKKATLNDGNVFQMHLKK